jgi:glycosyltransferase involved in cell wall biosynthesis
MSVGMGSTASREHDQLIVKVPGRKVESFRQLLQTPFWLLAIARILVERKFDIVYASNDWYGVGVFLMAQKVFKQKVILEVHGIPSEESKNWGKPTLLVSFLHFWEAVALRQCDSVIALSGHIFEFCRRYARRLEFVPVFVDTNVYRRNESARAALRKRYGWEDKRVVGLIGPFDIKWNEFALQFLEENIEDFHERIVFAIIGKSERKTNMKRCFYAGFVHNLPEFLSCLDAVLVARRLSTSGPLNKIVQSMSCSLPVFTTPEGMVGMDYAEHGRDIIVAKETEMVRTLNSLITDESLMTRIGRNARETVKKHYGHEANGAKLVRVVLDSLASPGFP